MLLRDWNCLVQQSSAWKYTHPAEDELVEARGGDASNLEKAANGENENNTTEERKEKMGWQYERVIKYNYSKEELSVLVDVISMIKSLASMIFNKEALLAPILRLYMHSFVQKFLNSDITPLMTRADQKGRPILQSLKSLQELGGDFGVGGGKHSHFHSHAPHDNAHATNALNTKIRVVGPSSTQLFLTRMLVRSLNDGHGRGMFTAKDIDAQSMAAFNNFYDTTHFFPYFASLSKTVQDCSYLGDLWYREVSERSERAL